MKARVYIAGPVTGVPQLNEPAFREMAAALERQGFEAVVPHDLVAADASHDEAMSLCLAALAECDYAVFLRGWGLSAGCREERSFCRAHGIPCWRGKSVERMEARSERKEI